MDFKMRIEIRYFQPKKVRNTKCLNPIHAYSSTYSISHAAMSYRQN